MALLSEFCQIYILYFDEVKGLIPILIFSNEFIKKNEKQIRPIKFYPIWFLDSENERDFEQINLVYNGKVYFAKKFKTLLKRKPRIKDENFDKAVIIIVLPKEFDIYGYDLLNIITKTVKKKHFSEFGLLARGAKIHPLDHPTHPLFFVQKTLFFVFSVCGPIGAFPDFFLALYAGSRPQPWPSQKN